MADVMTPGQRKRCMSRIHSKETKPEVSVRKWLYAHGIRYRKNDRRLPGTPDIVIPNGRLVIFVNGCFWHGHKGCKYFVIPKTRTEWWIKKITATQKRDQNKTAELEKLQWTVVTVWECELKQAFDATMENLLSTIMSARVAQKGERK